MRRPRNGIEAVGLDYACTKLKELVRASYAKRSVDSGPLGDQILWAVESLPDARTAGNWKEFDQLPDDIRKKLEAFIVQTEINFHATAACEEMEIAFPHLRRTSTPIATAIEVPKPSE